MISAWSRVVLVPRHLLKPVSSTASLHLASLLLRACFGWPQELRGRLAPEDTPVAGPQLPTAPTGTLSTPAHLWRTPLTHPQVLQGVKIAQITQMQQRAAADTKKPAWFISITEDKKCVATELPHPRRRNVIDFFLRRKQAEVSYWHSFFYYLWDTLGQQIRSWKKYSEMVDTANLVH